MTSTRLARGRTRFRGAALLALALPGLAACQSQRDVTGSIAPDDHRERHPIVLGDAPRVLDVFVEGPGGLVSRGRQDVAAFLEEYRRHGNSGLVAQVPVGTETAAATRRALEAIRAAAGGGLAVQPYRPSDPAMTSPIRLSFKRLQARVASKCGLWPQDLGVSEPEVSNRNGQYWNFGCASQSNLAAQVADPVDLVRGRQETPPDTGRRMHNIGQLRQSQDPSTTYKDQNVSVKSGISQ